MVAGAEAVGGPGEAGVVHVGVLGGGEGGAGVVFCEDHVAVPTVKVSEQFRLQGVLVEGERGKEGRKTYRWL